MNRYRALHTTFAALVLAASNGCALLHRPEPLTTLQVRFSTSVNNVEGAWPGSIALESIAATAQLKKNLLKYGVQH